MKELVLVLGLMFMNPESYATEKSNSVEDAVKVADSKSKSGPKKAKKAGHCGKSKAECNCDDEKDGHDDGHIHNHKNEPKESDSKVN